KSPPLFLLHATQVYSSLTKTELRHVVFLCNLLSLTLCSQVLSGFHLGWFFPVTPYIGLFSPNFAVDVLTLYSSVCITLISLFLASVFAPIFDLAWFACASLLSSLLCHCKAIESDRLREGIPNFLIHSSTLGL